MVFENLHWIDAETQAFLDNLVESLPTARVLLLVNYRPEYTHGWGGKTYYTQLRLDPLPTERAEELLAGPARGRSRPHAAQAAPGRAHRGQPVLPGGERPHPGRDRGVGGRAGEPIAWRSRCRAFRCRRRCRRSWRHVSTGCHLTRSASCRPRRSSARRSPWRSSRPSPNVARSRCAWASRICRPPSSSTRRASSLRSNTPSSMRSPIRWPTNRSYRSGGGRCMPASSRPWRRSPATGSPSRSNAWPTMPCGVRCGTRPWCTAGRRGRKPWRGRPTARPWGPSSRRSAPCQHLPETARHTRAGHRSPARPALGALAVGRLWAYSGVSARGRGPRGGPRRPASAGTGLRFLSHQFLPHGRV